MKPEFLLSRAAPGLAGYGQRIASTDRSIVWTSAEVGHALAGVPSWCRDLVLLKWAFMKMDVSVLCRGAARRTAKRVPIPARNRVKLLAMAKVALEEVVSATLCRHCDGRGFVRLEDNPNALVPCERCDALGVSPWSWRERARKTHCDEAAFRRGGWNRVYDELRRIYIGDEDQALRAVAKHVRGL